MPPTSPAFPPQSLAGHHSSFSAGYGQPQAVAPAYSMGPVYNQAMPMDMGYAQTAPQGQGMYSMAPPQDPPVQGVYSVAPQGQTPQGQEHWF